MHLSLASKISLAILGVLLLAVLSSAAAIYSAYWFEGVVETVVEDNLASVRAAEELEIALLEQRGYVSSYILDNGNTHWLDELNRRRRAFSRWLNLARDSARGAKERDELRELGYQVQLLMSSVVETQSDLKQSRSQLAHADKLAAVGKLAASVAHEIRNPLTAMKMWLYSLRPDVGPPSESAKKLEVVSEEIGRLEKIVSSFLEFSRPPQLKLEPQDVPEIIDRILELEHPRLEEQSIRVTRNSDHALPDVVADGEQLRQVFVNLISNAVEAMASGGELRVICKEELQKQGYRVRMTEGGGGRIADG